MTLALRRKRSDSTAHKIAEHLDRGTLAAPITSPMHRLRVPFGAQVAHLSLPGAKPQDRVALVAAAEVVHGGTGTHRRRAPSQRWQESAWELRKEVGEFRFTGDRVARAASQCWLYVGEVPASDDDTPNPVEDGPVYELGRSMFGDRGAGQQAMRLAGQHLQFNGESNLLISQDPDTGEMTWSAHSVDEITGTSTQYRLDDGIEPRDITENELVIRCWWPDPRKSGLADAPAQSVLPVARELRALTQHTGAQIDSRLAGAGILMVPNDIEIMAGQATTPKEGDASADMDPFVAALFEAMVTPLQDRDSAAAVVPLVIKVPPEAVDKIRHLTLASPLDPMAKDLREEAIRRVALGMDSDPGILLGQGGSNHWCVDESTEILTRERGWVTHAGLTAGDVVLTLNHETGLTEWQPVIDMYRAPVAGEPMVRVESPRMSALTTMGHRWPMTKRFGAREWTTSADILADTKRVGTKVQRYESLVLAAPHADLPEIAKHSDALVELMAWFYTEGTCFYRPGRHAPKVSIYQSRRVNPENCEAIRRALTMLFGPESGSLDKGGRYSTDDGQRRWLEAKELANQGTSTKMIAERFGVSIATARRWLRQDPKVGDTTPRWREAAKGDDMSVFRLNDAAGAVLVEHGPDRIVRREFIQSLTMAQLHLFIDTTVAADGWRNGPVPELGQKNPAMLEAFELAGILSGRNAREYPQRGIGRSAVGPAEKTLHVASLGQGTKFAPRGQHVTEETYTGIVWCPTTTNGTWLARRNGTSYFTGNSAWLVSEDEVKLVIAPTVATICHALTIGWLRPALELLGQDPRKYLVWFSASALELRPDKSQDSRALFDAGVMSEDATMRENGFNPDEDKAPDEERTRRLLTQLLLTKPEYAQTILEYLGVRLEFPDEPATEPAVPDVPDTAGEGGNPNDIPDRETTPPVNDQPTEPSA